MSSITFQIVVATGVAIAVATAAASVPATTAAPRPDVPRSPAQSASQATRHAKPVLDTSGRQRKGVASIYAKKFNGRKMADGTPMSPQDDNAASKTLPLGTTAKVTNVETGESAVVTIRDRGPHVRGRIIDLSPATAREVGIDRRQGISKVEVTPLTLPPRDDGARPVDVPPAAKAAGADRRSTSTSTSPSRSAGNGTH